MPLEPLLARIRPVARLESPYPGTNCVLKLCSLKTHIYDRGSCILEWYRAHLRKGEVFAYVGRIRNLKDLKDMPLRV